MNKKNVLFFVLAFIFIGGLYKLAADLFGGWGILVTIVATFAFFGACMFAAIGLIYYLAAFRYNRCAKRLREAGYAVRLHKQRIWEFATMALTGCLFTVTAVWMTHRFYAIYFCVQAGECWTVERGYLMASFMALMIWLIALSGICATISIWWRFLRPLRRHYNEMKLGRTLDLPRLN